MYSAESAVTSQVRAVTPQVPLGQQWYYALLAPTPYVYLVRTSSRPPPPQTRHTYHTTYPTYLRTSFRRILFQFCFIHQSICSHPFVRVSTR